MIDKLQSFLAGRQTMSSLVKNGIYILTLVAGSFLICKYAFGTHLDKEWLLGALLVPLAFILIQPLLRNKG